MWALLRNMHITPYRTAIFQLNEDLPNFIGRHISQVAEKDIVVVSSKLFCLWKGCAVKYENASQKIDLIRRESESVLPTKLAWLTIKNGMIMTNGGVDESNANGYLLWLPPDLYGCAAQLRQALCKHYGVKQLGVLVTDSMILPLRSGVIGAAVAYSGFKGVRDERGKKDIFGKPLQTTLVNLADGLAAAAAVTMGERDEQTPLAVITGAKVDFTDHTNPSELKYPPEQDLYAPLLQAAGLIQKEKKA